MRKIVLGFLVALLAMAVAAGPVAARALTDDEIKRTLAAIEEMKPLWDGAVDDSEEEDEAVPDFMVDPNMSDGVQGDYQIFGPEQIRDIENNAELRTILKRNGFTSETWAATANRVIKAFVAVEMGESMAEMRREMESEMAAIQKDPNLSPEQKQQIQAQMEGVMLTLSKNVEAPEEDKKAVMPYRERLAQTLEWNEDGMAE
ncbi:MAG: hypothetical protein EOM25_04065 [Deltaproteobacteria bacterium]|nr:hypothetical protein [Deltaproteobacteria bacterium]